MFNKIVKLALAIALMVFTIVELPVSVKADTCEVPTETCNGNGNG